MVKIYSGLILFGFLLFTSCTKEVHIPMPGYASKPVVYGIAKKNDSLKIIVSQTYSSYDTTHVSGTIQATISLNVNGAFIENLTPRDSFYIAKKYIPKEKDIINLSMVTYKGDKVTANTFIPVKVAIDTLIYKHVGGNDDYSNVTVKFKDPPTSDFYEILIEELFADSTKNIFLDAFKSTDPILISEESIGEDASMLFSDKMFNNKNVTINFSIPNFNYNSSEIPKLVLHFNHVTEDYYKFMNTLDKQSSSNSTSIFDLKSDPINVYTNVNGGYGIFTSITTTIDTLK